MNLFVVFSIASLVHVTSGFPFPFPEGRQDNEHSVIFFRTGKGKTGISKNRDMQPEPEHDVVPEPETDYERRQFQLCLMEKCRKGRRNCKMTMWKLRQSWNCDSCARKHCGMEKFTVDHWLAYNRFIGK